MDARFDGMLRESPGETGRVEALLPVRHGPESHASNLLELDNGDLLCAWFNGPGEGDPGTNIVVARLPAGADRWREPVLVAADPEHSEQNPVLAQRSDGTVWLWHTSMAPHDQTTARVVERTSEDGGSTWSAPRVVFDAAGTFLRNPPVRLSNGTWLLPAYHCRRRGDHSAMKISENEGRSWHEFVVPGSMGRVQPTVVEGEDGALLALFRSREADRIWASESKDLGCSWSTPERTELPNNNSAIQLVRLTDGRLALVYNDASLERDQFRWVEQGGAVRKKAVRTPLTLALSEDGGRTWPARRNVQTADLEYRGNESGYSYPSIVQDGDGRLNVTYSYLRKTIKHVRLDPSWATAGS